MTTKLSKLRIIAGKWRGRNIKFLQLEGVRPTKNSSRETLFNWLAPVISGANCLDLFAGSGALGFEALSRGAKHLTLVDSSMHIIKVLKENASTLGTNDINFYCAKIPDKINKIPKQEFDIVFLDPPFHHNLIGPTCEKLEKDGYLANSALIYIEAEKRLNLDTIKPNSWQILKRKTSGSVSYYLLTRTYHQTRACHQFARLSCRSLIFEHRTAAYIEVCEERREENR